MQQIRPRLPRWRDTLPDTAPMPSKGTPRHSIRIPDDLWADALEEARRRDEDLSEAIRKFLREYVLRIDQR